MQDKLEIKDKIKPLYNPNEAWLSSLLMRVLRLVVFLLIGLFLAYIESHEQSSKGIMTIYYEIFLSLDTLFPFSTGIVATLYLIKAKYQIILIVLGLTIGLEILWYPFSNRVINQVVLQFNRIRNLIKRKKSIFDDGARCVLLDGPWGSGKTTYYKNHIKPYFNSEPIYISCFSATRDQLITQLIIANPIFNLLSLHGVLSGLIKNSWQSFMPRNEIIVFDDLERLHKTKEDSFNDLIGILSYLKEINNCKLLLICNKEEINSQIFSKYLEKILDKEHSEFIPGQNMTKILKDYSRNNLTSNKAIKDELINVIVEVFNEVEYFNLRVIKLSFREIIENLSKYLSERGMTDDSLDKEKEQIILSFIEHIGFNIRFAIKLNKVYSNNYMDYLEIINLSKEIETYSGLNWVERVRKSNEDSEDNLRQEKQLENGSKIDGLLIKHKFTEIESRRINSNIPRKNIIEKYVGESNLAEFIYSNYLFSYSSGELDTIFMLYRQLLFKHFSKDTLQRMWRNIINNCSAHNSGQQFLKKYSINNADDLSVCDLKESFNQTYNNLKDDNKFRTELNKITPMKEQGSYIFLGSTFDLALEGDGDLQFNVYRMGTLFAYWGKNELLDKLYARILEDERILRLEDYFNSLYKLIPYFYQGNQELIATLGIMFKYYNSFINGYFEKLLSQYQKQKKLKLFQKLTCLLDMHNFKLIKINNKIRWSLKLGDEIKELITKYDIADYFEQYKLIFINYIQILCSKPHDCREIPKEILEKINFIQQHDVGFLMTADNKEYKWLFDQIKQYSQGTKQKF